MLRKLFTTYHTFMSEQDGSHYSISSWWSCKTVLVHVHVSHPLFFGKLRLIPGIFWPELKHNKMDVLPIIWSFAEEVNLKDKQLVTCHFTYCSDRAVALHFCSMLWSFTALCEAGGAPSSLVLIHVPHPLPVLQYLEREAQSFLKLHCKVDRSLSAVLLYHLVPKVL